MSIVKAPPIGLQRGRNRAPLHASRGQVMLSDGRGRGGLQRVEIPQGDRAGPEQLSNPGTQPKGVPSQPVIQASSKDGSSWYPTLVSTNPV